MVMSKITKSVATKITTKFDNLAEAMFGGQLEKAQFLLYAKPDLNAFAEIPPPPDSPAGTRSTYKVNESAPKAGELNFFINPHTIQVVKEAQLKEEVTNQATNAKKFSNTYPVCLKLGEIWFDTYDERVSVRTKYINTLESLLDYLPDTHVLPIVVFNWGQFHATGLRPSEYKFFVTKIAVDYTLFLPDGTPVRAKCDVSLEQVAPRKDEFNARQKQSPDHAKLYTVKKGDTLQGIAMAEYDDPREWRRIAKTNKLDDPLSLRPGMKLLVPPILK